MSEIISAKKINIIIVDDHQMFIDGIKTLLRFEKNLNIVGEALDGNAALILLKEKEVDIVISDIEMPGMSGIELTKEIKKNYPEIKVLVLTMYNDREIVNEILMTEAEGYVLKNTGKQELITAINKIADDSTFYSHEVVELLMGNYAINKKIDEILNDLTPREKEIIALICDEMSNAEIAEKLFISPLTVETHRKNILRKTKVKTIVGLIKFAINNKLDKYVK